MQLAMMWEQVQRVQQELKQGSRETQDTAIAALQETLDTCSSVIFPSFAYPLLTDVLHFYCRNILPYIGIPAEDQRFVREEFERTITHLNTQEHMAKHLEAQLKHFFRQVKSGTLGTIKEIITTLSENISFGRENSPPPLVGGVRGGGFVPKEVQKSYRAFKKSPFTASHVIPFFEAMIAQFPPEIKELFEYMSSLFWHQLYDFIHMKNETIYTITGEMLCRNGVYVLLD